MFFEKNMGKKWPFLISEKAWMLTGYLSSGFITAIFARQRYIKYEYTRTSVNLFD